MTTVSMEAPRSGLAVYQISKTVWCFWRTTLCQVLDCVARNSTMGCEITNWKECGRKEYWPISEHCSRTTIEGLVKAIVIKRESLRCEL